MTEKREKRVTVTDNLLDELAELHTNLQRLSPAPVDRFHVVQMVVAEGLKVLNNRYPGAGGEVCGL